MKAFQWNACFITGLHDVDEQHHRLVDLINRFGELIMDRDGATDASLDSVFLELADYSRWWQSFLIHAMSPNTKRLMPAS